MPGEQGKSKDELFNGDIYTTLLEAKVLIENWRKEYNQIRPLLGGVQ
jgi:hypothetical protein